MFGVSVVIFLLMHLAPGDAATVLLGPQATEAAKAELRHALGLDQPLPVQYRTWLARTLTGDFGTSIATQLPVVDPGAAALRQHPDPDFRRACCSPS